jgi:hypothetical protein
MDKPMCKLCGRFETRRVSRHGFFQQVVLSKLGFSPWECVFCREVFFRRQRRVGRKVNIV